MSSTIGGQFHSISVEGMAIFNKPIETTIGGIVVDLASAPIAPGTHTLYINGTVGGIEVYLPRYVTVTVEGGAAIGGQDVHDGHSVWNRLASKVKHALHLSNQIPDHAVDNPTPGQPIALKLVVNTSLGGVDIYRI